MTKSKKKRNLFLTVYATIEGEKRELILFKILQDIYLDRKKIKLTINPVHGGNPNFLLNSATRYISFNYNRMFVWIDEDIDLNRDSRETLCKYWCVTDKNTFYSCPLGQLQNRYNQALHNPVLIVSQPICVESLILSLLGKRLPHQHLNSEILKKQKRELKNSLSGVIGSVNEYEYLAAKLTKEVLEEKRLLIPELELLLSMITS